MSSDSHPPPERPLAKPESGYAALRRHRWSAAGAEYFVTINAQRPAAGLIEPGLIGTVRREIEQLQAERAWCVRTWVVMPDHVHLLFTLGEADTLSQCLRLLKGRLSRSLRSHQLRWQDGFYEHRMRPDEDRLPVFLYVFLNPYHANLLSADERYPAYFCSDEDWAWFEPLTNSCVPFPEWLP